MLRILQLLKESKIIKSYELLDFKQGKDFYYVKIKAVLIDNSLLHVREFTSKDERIYSYHWQDKNGELICRWDNAPHHKVETFPHHKHTEKGVKASYETSLEEVLRKVEEMYEADKRKGRCPE
jgi:hypothetical protein